MPKYVVTRNNSDNSCKFIEAHALLLDGNIAKFRDASGEIIALYSVKKFNIKKEKD